ncbi:MAG: glycosyltransferase family 2 protein [Slackia sp.]|nr:glycosyltransferase family 2 protein [Slackia sp.]
MKLLVIIPAYNEQDCIVETVSELQRATPQFDYVVVNDGSKDDTKKLCLEHGFNLIDLPVNIGLTGGFQTGMKYALRHGYDAAVQFDADGQHVPSYLEKLAEEMERTNADIVIGSRFVTEKKSASLRMIGSRLISAITKITTGASISDPTSGLRMYNRAMIEVFSTKSDFGPEPDSIAYLARKGAKIREVQVSMRERQAGESYLTFTRSIEYMMRTCISILFVQWFRS